MALDTSNAWYTERDKIAIVGASGTNSQSFSDPDAGATVRLHVTKLDESFILDGTDNGIGLNESPNIPSQFHRALAYWVIAHGYEIQGSQEEDASVLQLAGYWGQKFEKEIIEAKRYSNKKRNDSGYSIVPQDY